MCLSKVYRDRAEEDALLLEDVCTIRAEEGNVILTDIMGVQVSIPGHVQYADLTGGVVIVKAEG